MIRSVQSPASTANSRRICPEGEETPESVLEQQRANLFHPEQDSKTKWDLFVAVLIIYSTISVPFRICFDADAEGFAFVLDVFVDLCFLVDIIFNFRCGYINADGDVVWDVRKIRNNYLAGWFSIDFLSTFPIDRVAQAAMPSGGGGGSLRAVKLVRILRLVRLMKLMKLAGSTDALEEYELPVNTGALSIITMLCKIVFLAHLFGCFWYMLGTSGSLGTTWFQDRYGDDDGDTIHMSIRYTASLYWAITTMATVGYGDINTQNDAERAYAVFVMLVGASTFGYTVGMISLMVESVDIRGAAASKKVMALKAYMKEAELSREFQRRLRRQCKYSISHKTVFNEQELQQTLSPSLLVDMNSHGAHSDLVDRLPGLLGNAHDPSFTATVIPLLKPFFVMELEVLIEEGAVGCHCYWMLQGELLLRVRAPEPGGEALNKAIKKAPETTGRLSVSHINLGYVVPNIRSSSVRRKSLRGIEDRDLWVSDAVGYSFVGDGSVAPCSVSAGQYSQMVSLSKRDLQYLKFDWPEFPRELAEQATKLKVACDACRIRAQAKALDRQEATANNVEECVETVDKLTAEEIEAATAKKMAAGAKAMWTTHGVIHPEYEPKLKWDIGVGVLIVYSVVVVPYRIAFAVDATGVLFAFDVIVDVMFAFDMVLGFMTAYVDAETVTMVTNKASIRSNYIKGWFVVDFLSTFPIDRIAGAFTDEENAIRSIKLLRVLRLARLAKLAKILTNGPLFEKIDDFTSQMNSAVFKVPYLFFGMVFCAHLIGCAWYMVGAVHLKGGSWLNDYYSGQPLCEGEVCEDWTLAVSVDQRYLTSFYWALTTMTTVGYGDISPNGGVGDGDANEMVAAMLAMLFGTTIFAYVIGEIVVVVLHFDPSEQAHKQKKQVLKAYFTEKRMGPRFKTTARKNLSYNIKFKSVFKTEKLFDEIPDFLMNRLVQAKYQPTIERHPLFHETEELHPGFCRSIVPFLQPLVCRPGENVLEVGQTAVAMFFVEKGSCICQQTGAQFEAGASFAMECLFPPAHLKNKHLTYSTTVSSQGEEDVHLLAFTRRALEEARIRVPPVVVYLAKWCYTRQAESADKGTHWLQGGLPSVSGGKKVIVSTGGALPTTVGSEEDEMR